MQKMCIVFFATAWGSRHGGINAFNYDLCKALSELNYLDLKLICIVDEVKEGNELEEAKSFGIELLSIPWQIEPRSYEKSVCSQLSYCGVSPKWMLGHDAKTGSRAIEISKSFGASVAVFHHMDYAAYKSLQGRDDENLIIEQRRILSAADVVFAVGPKLGNSARDSLRGVKDVNVIEILPGLTEVEGLERSSRFSAVTFGRLNPENNLLKQTRLAVASFASARNDRGNPLGQDAELTVIGLPPNERDHEHQSLLSLAEGYAKRVIPIHGWQFVEDRPRLFDHLRRQTVCMMLSLHEGFGLVGLEAISAEVPLIISKNSGLYHAVEKELKGSGTGCLHPVDILGSSGEEAFQEQDIEKVAGILIEIALNRDKAKENAQSLKRRLASLWTWEKTARQVFNSLTSKESVSQITFISDASSKKNSEFETSSSQIHADKFKEPKKRSLKLVPRDILMPEGSSKGVSFVKHPDFLEQETSKFKKEIISLIKNIESGLQALAESELQRILDFDDLPYPAMFDEVGSKPTFVMDALTVFSNLSEKHTSSSCAVLISEACDLLNIVSDLLNMCFQQISILRKTSSRKNNSYSGKLEIVKNLFNQIKERLLDLISYLKQFTFQVVP
jgi:glycosyltransferase involved in cell wall biosynthesis